MEKVIFKEEDRMHDFYIAGPLFTDAEREYNLGLFRDLSVHGFKVFLPQLTEKGSTTDIFEKNLVNLSLSRMVIAICDGADMDSGTSWECGYFYGQGSIYALRTDFRKSADDPHTGINLMIGESANRVFTDKDELVGWMIQCYKRR